MVSESLFGAKPTLGWTGSLSGTGRVGGGRHGGTEVLGQGTQPLLGPRSPGTEGKRDTGLPGRRGRGRQSPEFPPLNIWVWKRLLGTEHRAQLAAQLLFGQLRTSRWGGRSLHATLRLLKGPVEDSIWHLCSSILGQHEQGRGGGHGTLRWGALGWGGGLAGLENPGWRNRGMKSPCLWPMINHGLQIH